MQILLVLETAAGGQRNRCTERFLIGERIFFVDNCVGQSALTNGITLDQKKISVYIIDRPMYITVR